MRSEAAGSTSKRGSSALFRFSRAGRALLAAPRVATALLLAAAGLSCVPNAGCPNDFTPVSIPEFLFGLSQTPADVMAIANEVGAGHVRPTLSWRSIEPSVEPIGLTVDAVRSDPSQVSQYLASHDWTPFDSRLGEIAAAGLVPVPIVGHGYSGSLPLRGGVPAAPDVLGREEYLARQYLFTRAVVERYDGDGVDDAPSGLRIPFWQTENELNQAFFTAIFGWRHPAYFGALASAWMDFEYLTRLLRTLRMAVKDADPTALTTMNFHSDVHPMLNQYFRQPGWLSSIVLWRMEMDVVSFDAYPNYYRSTPPAGSVVGERAAQVATLSCGMPVMVMETGYPSAPAEAGFDEAKQAAFLRDAFDSSVAAGVRGFFVFGARTSETHTATITPEDLAALDQLAGWIETGDAPALLTYAFANPDYMQNHLVEVVQAVEGHWGLYRADGSEKPSLEVMREIGRSLPD
ncbi:hypothetical protein MYXO_02965 [Myxococcaceae bacterium]|jgi:hypothetical protein|nr:hypothetical protein MYXO_02965 [Myxococcaceae bacterium]